ncbi:hypothetical protein ACPWT1_02475 [Ramlibacter sp. MMS24-I3-19]|uniref:hypothetical protein n=1 Tax=Ramlibacter sp. MMS24-I3-19 TaxID=3416606 RepID=UPI003CFC2E96
MFFQLSLPSTPAATDAVGDPALPELGTAGTLTIGAPHDASHVQVARLLAARLREPRDALRVRIACGSAGAMTFTAPPLPEAPEQALVRLQ